MGAIYSELCHSSYRAGGSVSKSVPQVQVQKCHSIGGHTQGSGVREVEAGSLLACNPAGFGGSRI